ncbi:ferric reductase-like transmembrane domain-containing protein [Vibrio sp. FNV 38]|nr:ferric reductase-like transmembrane domain-containing protein [Vibrio sp. FNV 38]
MNKIAIAFGLSIAATVLLWMSVDTLSPEPLTHIAYRQSFTQFTGVIAIVAMSLCMITSLRTHQVNRSLGGLDKVYRLHKWLGITGLIFSILHWLARDIASKVVPLVEITKRTRPEHVEQSNPFLALIEQSHDIAESAGEYGFYAVAIFTLIALARFVPYHVFRKAHHFIAIIFLTLVFHSVVLTNPDYWFSAFGLIYGAIIFLGSVAALSSLFGKIGQSNQTTGKITQIIKHNDIDVVEVTIIVDSPWQGHKAGQFAFLTSKKNEGAHPYTIASTWDEDTHELTFIIKALGDWTSQLKNWFEVDMPVTVEGPYGEFDFIDHQSHQIWIAAGIGITPFIAKLKERERNNNKPPVDLFICLAKVSNDIKSRLEMRAKNADVRLHWFIGSEGATLSSESITAIVKNWDQESAWFCGPAPFGKAIKKQLVKKGLLRQHFHQEMFKFR